jgi:hypothetical protein
MSYYPGLGRDDGGESPDLVTWPMATWLLASHLSLDRNQPGRVFPEKAG